MRERPPRSVNGRAIIAVIALYALVLQAFLTALVPAPPAAAGSEICAQHDAAGAPADETPGCRHHACCTQAQAVGLALPPAAFAALAWPPAAAPAPRRAREAARAPPDQGTSPRGPPSA